MEIKVENTDQKIVLESLLRNLKYEWDRNGEDSDAWYKTFEYINDRPECWNEEGEIVKDYHPVLKEVIKMLVCVKVDVEKYLR